MKRQFIKTIGLITVSAGCLVGCAGMNSQFDCNKVGGQGVGCASLDQVNTMADQGKFNHSPAQPMNFEDKNSGLNQSSLTMGAAQALNQAGTPVRTGESIQQIWVAPYIDAEDNYHQPSQMYTVIEPSQWVGSPVKTVQLSDTQSYSTK